VYRIAHHGRYSEAIGDASKVISAFPDYGPAYEARAHFETDAGLYVQARADLDRVAAMHPDDIGLALFRIELDLRQGDAKSASADIVQAQNMRATSHWHQAREAGSGESNNGTDYVISEYGVAVVYAYRSITEQLQHQDAASLNDMEQMMKLEVDQPYYILAKYCDIAASAGLLDSAELTCQESIENNSHDIGQFDTLGLVHLRMKEWDKALADYNTALAKRPDLTLSLYGRGICRRARGDVAGSDADIAAATHDEPDIANIMRRLGAPTL
jgi:tetratricopeptide (TPR) repeat protein